MTSINLQELFAQHQREDQIAYLEPGTYDLEVTRCGVKVSQKGEGITPTFRVVGGPHAGETAMLGSMMLTQDSRNIFFRNVKGFGLDKEFFERSPTMKQVAEHIVGRVVRAQVLADQYQGQNRNKLAIGGLTLVSVKRDPFANGVSTAPPASVQSAPTVAETVPPAPPPVPRSEGAPF